MAVLLEPEAPGLDLVYQVFTDLGVHRWINKTVISPRRVGREFPKTFGHYHSKDIPETYLLSEGKGVLVLQRPKEKIQEVVIVTPKINEEIVITPEWGHSWSNIGESPLVLFDDWSAGHEEREYEPMKRHKGLAYYIVTGQDGPIAIKNDSYLSYLELPEPQWITVEEYNQRFRGAL